MNFVFVFVFAIGNLPPDIASCPQDINLQASESPVTYTFREPIATDDSGITPAITFYSTESIVFLYDETNQTYINAANIKGGATTVVVTVTDDTGLTASCSFIITLTIKGKVFFSTVLFKIIFWQPIALIYHT